jgi:TonB-dependent receptor
MRRLFWISVLIILNLQFPSFAVGRQNIDLVIQQESLPAVLTKLEKKTGYNFVYKPQLISHIIIANKTFQGKGLWYILDELLKDQHLAYTVKSTNIILSQASPPPPVQNEYGKITGRVVDFENGDPLPGATVRIQNTDKALITDEKGDFVFNKVPPGRYTILISYTGYQSGMLTGIIVTASRNSIANVKLQAGNSMQQVVVKAIPRKKVVNTTDEQLVRELYNARTVISGISNEQIARSMDRDAAEVVKRIPGVNVSEDRFIVVRGLNKRYNMTFLNDNLAPATELDSRAFSFDVLSSNVIDKIMIYKSPSPDLPGEFAGGVVKITTKKSMLTRQLDIQLSAQYRPGSGFTDILTYPGSKTDFLGFDNGTRSLPKGIPNTTAFNLMGTDLNAHYSKQFKNNYLTRKQFFDIDKRLTINYYDTWKIGHLHLNNLSSISYTNTHESRETEQQSYYKIPQPMSRGMIQQGISTARLSLIQNNNIKLNEHVRLELKQFVNQQGHRIALNNYSITTEHPDMEWRRSGLFFQSNFLYSGQLSAYLKPGKKDRTQLFANIGYSTIRRNDPDMRELGFHRKRDSMNSFTQDNPKNPWMHGSVGVFSSVSRFFIDVREKAYQTNIDMEHRFSSFLNLKAGAFHETRQRKLSTRTFTLENGPYVYDPNIMINGDGDEGAGTGGTEEQLPYKLRSEIFRSDGTGLRYLERTAPNDQYFAENLNTAGYISLDLQALHNKLNIFGGLRVENNQFHILGALQAGQANYPMVVERNITSALPSVNISYKPDSSFIIRTGFGKTLNRPEFREAAPFDFYDYVNYEHYFGNPDLSTVNIDNFDLRLEWYPKSRQHNELFNIGFFYKKLDQPIERIWSRGSTFQSSVNSFYFVNTGPTTVFGFEAEIRKSLSFIPGNFFRDLSVILNGAVIRSESNVPALVYPGQEHPRKRPLQGQVPYLVNASLNYENPKHGIKAAIIYHHSGDQIYAIGTSSFISNQPGSGFPDIMEKGRGLLDLSWSQRLNRYFSIRAGVQNLLNTPWTLYEDYNRDYKYQKETSLVKDGAAENSGDVIYRRYYQRPYYSLGVNFIF